MTVDEVLDAGVFRVRGGKIVAFEQFADTLEVAQAIGG